MNVSDACGTNQRNLGAARRMRTSPRLLGGKEFT